MRAMLENGSVVDVTVEQLHQYGPLLQDIRVELDLGDGPVWVRGTMFEQHAVDVLGDGDVAVVGVE